MAVTPLPTPEPDDSVVIDLDALTLADLEELEEKFNKSAGELMREMRTSTLRFLVYLSKRRTDPSYTYDDTANLTMSQVRMGEVDPTGGSGS